MTTDERPIQRPPGRCHGEDFTVKPMPTNDLGNELAGYVSNEHHRRHHRDRHAIEPTRANCDHPAHTHLGVSTHYASWRWCRP
jgi:hypothetical protein